MSDKHQLVLEFIRAYIKFHGISPSYQTIALGLGMKSKANIHRIIHRLQEEGHLTIRPYKFNSIKLTDKSAKEMATL
jgi:SOS-response transcriptional repressor LexA